MSNEYYYFAASLPMISLKGKLPMAVEAFLEAARRLLADGDRELVEQLLTGDEPVETDNAAALAWIAFDRNFRNEIAWFRAQRAHKNPQKSVHGVKEDEPWLREAVHEASRMPDLLEAERLLDRTAWQFLDDLAGGHYYDLEFLICYGLKLKILEKHHQYKSSKGNEVFDGIKTMELPVDWAAASI
ncbi:MAG: DUF2764 family protein [Candidatus Omnitrophica bacterium]|nr:DUF2764 family protein [Candidatus Omnitrophota bacterium]